ncbi:MAG: hypothetical protein JXR07_20410 [Reichenbachiella sp.]
MSIVSNIAQLIEHEGISFNKFDASVNKSAGYFKKQVRNGKSVGIDILEVISKVYPHWNINWIVTSVGEMILSKKYEVGAAIQKVEDPKQLYSILEEKDKLIAALEELVDVKQKLIEKLENEAGTSKS